MTISKIGSDKIALKAKKNSMLIQKCHDYGGEWDPVDKEWIFSDIVSDKIAELDAIYDSPLVAVEITAKRELNSRPAIEFLGCEIARAWGRDSGAKLAHDVAKISGTVRSAGSMKNWVVEIQPQATFRLKVPERLLDLHDETKDWEIRKLDNGGVK